MKLEITKKYNTQKSDLSNLKKDLLLKRFDSELEVESYYESNKVFYLIALYVSVLAQVGSLVSSYAFFENVISQKLKNEFALALTSFVIILLIEIVKYFALQKTLKKVFAKKRSLPTANIILSVLICSFSAYASVVGAKEVATTNEVQNEIIANAKLQIETIKKEISQITNKSDFKNVVWANGIAKEVLTEQGKNLVTSKENEIDKIKRKLEKDLSKNDLKNLEIQNNFQIFFGIFELLFLICNFFIWNFKRNCVMELDLCKSVKSELQSTEPVIQMRSNQNEAKVELRSNENEFEINEAEPIQSNKPKKETKLFLEKLERKKSKYLEKYLEIVEVILENNQNGIPDMETKKQVLANFDIGVTTYYNIKRIIENA
jgi:hypothetical protein